VTLDVLQGNVSRAGARAHYGVCIGSEPTEPCIDAAPTAELRARMRRVCGRAPSFDRGPGCERLSGNDAHADVDVT
jgi:hypothetical protein